MIFNLLFNIYNVFKVEAINMKTRRGELLYGELPVIDKMRQNEKVRGTMSKS